MRNTIRQALQKLKEDFNDDKIFTNPKQFRAALSDVQIGTDEKKIRHVLNVAIRDMQAYSRLASELESNPFAIDNLVVEMSTDYMVSKDVAQMTIECVAELLGYVPRPESTYESKRADYVQAEKKSEVLAHDVQGDVHQNYLSGIDYYNKGDFHKAQQLLLKAAESGNLEAQCAIGDIFASENNPNADPAEAMKWYLKAAENGHGKAQWLVGAGYFNGVGIEADMQKAKHWFEKSAQQGNADGRYGLAGYYFSRQEYAQAEQLLKKAAEQGHSDAIAMLEMASPLFRG